MSEVKKTFKVPKNRVGYVSKSKSGKSIITVEQDITLKAGQKIILTKPAETIDRLLAAGIIDEATAEKRKSSTPEWKTFEAELLPDMKKD
jgi:hypothetical protein